MAAQLQVPQPVRRVPHEPHRAADHHVALRGDGEPRVRDELRRVCGRAYPSSASSILFAVPLTAAVLPALPFSAGLPIQDIDFAALYKAYDDELMAWKAVIDERHRGEKKSSGLYPLLTATLSAAPDWLTSCSRFVSADPATVMEITLIYW